MVAVGAAVVAVVAVAAVFDVLYCTSLTVERKTADSC